MADDDDWDTVPVQLNVRKPITVNFSDEEQEQVDVEEIVTSKESTKPKNAVDERAALAKAKVASKAKQKEREDEMAKEAERARNARPLTAEEKAAEALRLRKLVEEADNELTKDLFSGVAGSKEGSGPATGFAAKHADGVQDTDSLAAMLHLVDLSGPKQALELATALSRKLEIGTAKKISLAFLKDLLRGSTVSLNDEEVTELVNLLSVIKNEKVKARMAKKKSAAAAAPKPKLNSSGLDKPGGDRFDMDAVDERGGKGGKKGQSAYDDDDFM